jgi:RNA polymerase sigma factor (sigma-70 family)
LLTPEELKTAERVAGRIGSKWSAVEIDDLTSHLYLWLVENKTTVERWRGDEYGAGKLYVSLRREAAKFCAREQSARSNRTAPVSNFYNRDLLDRALPFIFEATPQTTSNVDPQTGRALESPSEFDTAVSIMADIRGAFYGLNRQIREILELRYRDGLTLEEIGEIQGITKDGAKKRLDRALSRLSDALAG